LLPVSALLTPDYSAQEDRLKLQITNRYAGTSYVGCVFFFLKGFSMNTTEQAREEEIKKSRDQCLEMILRILSQFPPVTWKERHDLLQRKFGIKASRFKDIRGGRRSLTNEEVQGMKQKLGASGTFVPWEIFLKVKK